MSSPASPSEKPNPFYLPPDVFPGRREFIGLMAASFGWALLPSAFAEDSKPKTQKGDRGGEDQTRARGPVFRGPYALPESLAEFAALSVVLGRATDNAITTSVLSQEPMEGFFEIGTAPGRYSRKTAVTKFPAGEPVEIVFENLKPRTQHYYRINYRKPGTTVFSQRAECSFATQRARGDSFVFTLQGDSHPERPQSSHPDLYARTLVTAADDHPDFHICLGDDFSVEKVRDISPASLAAPYLLQRPFLGLVGQTAPVFLMNGNHEQASLFNYQQTDERRDVAVGVQNARNRLFPTVAPDHFFSGNTETFEDIGLLKNYCAWTWGDALFVILDNYWHSPALVDSGFGAKGKGGPGGGGADGKKNRDWWEITIGDAQYRWLKRTLETSTAKHKFVFAHHVLGTGRGGVEEAGLYEWGGRDRRGDDTFAQRRPGWELPIHALMVKHKVSIFFQGHDHLYCQQEKDGVIYQEVPMPSDHGYVAYNTDRYTTGKKLPSSGYLRVTVTPADVKVDYVRSFLPKDETAETRHGMVAHSYRVPSKGTTA